MPEIPTAADKLAAIDLVAEIADQHGLNGFRHGHLAAFRSDAERQHIEDRAVGEAMCGLGYFIGGAHETIRLGALVRAAVEAAGGSLVFGDAPGPAEPPTGHTAPGIDTPDRTPDPDRDIYDEIRTARAAMLVHDSASTDRNEDMRDLTRDAIIYCRDAISVGADGGARRKLINALALLVTAVEVCDA